MNTVEYADMERSVIEAVKSGEFQLTDLSKQANIPYQTICRIHTGKVKRPSASTIQVLSLAIIDLREAGMTRTVQVAQA
jgi:predicted transcriptional regulator